MPTYAYEVQRNLDGTGANSWLAGDALANTGQPGNGYIHQYATAGRFAGSGPTMVGMVRTGTMFNAVRPRWAIGNLDGLYGYSGDIYGSAFGDPLNAHLKIDATNGIRIGHGASTKIHLDASGNASFVEGGVTLNNTGITLAASAGTAYSAGTSYKWTFGDSRELGISGASTVDNGQSMHVRVLGANTSLFQVQSSSGLGSFTSIINAQADAEARIRLEAKHGVTVQSDALLLTGGGGAALVAAVEGAMQFTLNTAGAPTGGLAKNSANGLHLCPVSGSTYDLAITNAANSAYALALKTGTVNLFIGGVPDFGGATSGTAGALVGYINIQVAGTNFRVPYHATS